MADELPQPADSDADNPYSVELKVNVTATYRRLISWWARRNRARC